MIALWIIATLVVLWFGHACYFYVWRLGHGGCRPPWLKWLWNRPFRWLIPFTAQRVKDNAVWCQLNSKGEMRVGACFGYGARLKSGHGTWVVVYEDFDNDVLYALPAIARWAIFKTRSLYWLLEVFWRNLHNTRRLFRKVHRLLMRKEIN